MKLLFFKAPWCSACHSIEPHVPEFCIKIDCDESPEKAEQYNISSLPMFIAVRDDDTEIARIQTTNMQMLGGWYRKLEE